MVIALPCPFLEGVCVCLSSPLFDVSGARPVDFLPCACYPSRPAVSGSTGVYSSTTHHFVWACLHICSFLLCVWIKCSWKMANKVSSVHLQILELVSWQRLKWLLCAPKREWLTQKRGFLVNSRELQWVPDTPRCTRSRIIHSRFKNMVSHYNEAARSSLCGGDVACFLLD